MAIDAQQILTVLDYCCDKHTFPMLDNGYVYLAATRLSLYRAPEEWGVVIETFGFSPRAGLPDTTIYTFASTLCNRDIPAGYGPKEIANLLATQPNNDMRFVYPIESGDWQDSHDDVIAAGVTELVVRGRKQAVPSLEVYERRGIALKDPPRVQVFEFCRYLADVARDLVLATPEERRMSLLPGMTQILQLEAWRHPNVVDTEERPGRSGTFQQLAEVLATGRTDSYHPSQPANTHWKNWPDGGSL